MQNSSLYRIKHLILSQLQGSMPKWIGFAIILASALILALFLVWLDYGYEILVFIIYSAAPYSYFSFLESDKSKVAHYLLLPTSTAEKIIAHLISTISFSTILLALIFGFILLIQGIINVGNGLTFLSYMPVFEILNIKIFLIGFLIQSLFCFMTISYRKKSLQNSTLVGLVLVFIFIFISSLKRNILSESFPYQKAYLYYDQLFGINLNSILSLAFNGIVFLLIILFWVANFYKLREREL